MGYVIFENNDTLRLTAEVQQYMTKGWKPLGGISCYYNSRTDTTWYVQAMMRESTGKTESGAALDPTR